MVASSIRTYGSIFLSVIFSFSISAISVSAEDDVVRWQKPMPASESVVFEQQIQTIHGKILDLNARRLQIIPRGSEQPMTIAGDQVVGVEVAWQNQTAREANQAFLEHRWRETITLAQTAVNNPDIVSWQQELLSLHIVAAATHYDRIDIAAKVFGLLEQRGLADFGLAYLPVPWTTVNASQSTLATAKSLVDNESETMRFIAAAWLLDSADRPIALEKLKLLAANSSSRLAPLARAQLWRAEPPHEFVANQINDAQRACDRMPLSLQAGPQASIADRVERSGNLTQAFTRWTEVAIMSQPTQLVVFTTAIKHLEDIAKRNGQQVEWDQLRAIFSIQ